MSASNGPKASKEVIDKKAHESAGDVNTYTRLNNAQRQVILKDLFTLFSQKFSESKEELEAAKKALEKASTPNSSPRISS